MGRQSEFDLAFRPASYWEHADPLSAIISDIKGDLRRAMVRDVVSPNPVYTPYYSALMGELPADLLNADAPEGFVRFMGASHPHWLGGEYLPDYLPGEVEIARITLESVTRDVISIRARRSGKRIYYRMVDEHETEYVLPRRWSLQPLTQGQLIDLIEHAARAGENRSDLSFTDQLREGAADLDEQSVFVNVSSLHYPHLERWYVKRAEHWQHEALLEYLRLEASDHEEGEE